MTTNQTSLIFCQDVVMYLYDTFLLMDKERDSSGSGSGPNKIKSRVSGRVSGSTKLDPAVLYR